MDGALRAKNAEALRRSLAWMMLLPITVCFVVNSYLHRAYPRDKRMWSAPESECSSKPDPSRDNQAGPYP